MAINDLFDEDLFADDDPETQRLLAPFNTLVGKRVASNLVSPESTPGFKLGENLITAQGDARERSFKEGLFRSGLAGSPSGPGLKNLNILDRREDIDIGNLALEAGDLALDDAIRFEEGIENRAVDRELIAATKDLAESDRINALIKAGGGFLGDVAPSIIDILFGKNGVLRSGGSGGGAGGGIIGAAGAAIAKGAQAIIKQFPGTSQQTANLLATIDQKLAAGGVDLTQLGNISPPIDFNSFTPEGGFPNLEGFDDFFSDFTPEGGFPNLEEFDFFDDFSNASPDLAATDGATGAAAGGVNAFAGAGVGGAIGGLLGQLFPDAKTELGAVGGPLGVIAQGLGAFGAGGTN